MLSGKKSEGNEYPSKDWKNESDSKRTLSRTNARTHPDRNWVEKARSCMGRRQTMGNTGDKKMGYPPDFLKGAHATVLIKAKKNEKHPSIELP